MMFDILLLLTWLLLILTLGASFLFYRRLREVKEKYVEAKEVVGDIVISFNRQLDRHEEVLDSVKRRAEVSYLKSSSLEGKVSELEGKIEKLAAELKGFRQLGDKLDEKVEKLAESYKKIEERLVELENLEYQLSTESEDLTSVTPIPIKRDKVLSRLTETELTVLKILADEGPKTAPQIRSRIKLSREHTARLMKKLYEQGYLERNTSKIPYSYRIKEEMLSLLKKRKTSE